MADIRGRRHLFRIGQQFVTGNGFVWEIRDIKYSESRKTFIYTIVDSKNDRCSFFRTEKAMLGLVGSREWILY